MIIDKKYSEKVAEILLNINAVKLQPSDFFTWSSGKKSPIYCDNRLILSYIDEREFIGNLFCKYIKKKFPNANCIAGVATGAIAHGIIVASKLNLPFVYVRDKAKGHGRQNQIEGNLIKDSNVVVIEDLISTGTSSINAIHALTQAKSHVRGLLSIFTYELVESTKFKIPYFSLCDYSTLIQVANKKKMITKKEKEILKNWKKRIAVN